MYGCANTSVNHWDIIGIPICMQGPGAARLIRTHPYCAAARDHFV